MRSCPGARDPGNEAVWGFHSITEIISFKYLIVNV